jgi:hypothetical protein
LPRTGLLLLGLWLGLVVASWAMASASFRTVERVLGPAMHPELGRKLAPLPAEDRRVVLRHLASEVNRWMFGAFGLAQIALALGVVALAWPAGGEQRYLLVAAAALVLAQLVAARSIVELGRSIDFVPRPLPADVARRFGGLHAAYVISDLLKAGLLVAAAWLARRA